MSSVDYLTRNSEEVRNPSTFKVDDRKRLVRFLILGSEGGTYYASEKKLTIENAECIKRLVSNDTDGVWTVQEIAKVSDAGRAPKNDPALFALAVAAKFGTPLVKREALLALPRVARIGTHLFHFLQFCTSLDVGWGRGLRKAVGSWYTTKNEAELARMLVKYQSRDGWSNRDALRLSHPKPLDVGQQAIFHWAVNGTGEGRKWEAGEHPGVEYLAAFDALKVATEVSQVVELVDKYNFPREAIPTQFLNSPEVWSALLPRMGLEAMIRNLGKMTEVGVISPLSEAEKAVCNKLLDEKAVVRARLHPLKILVARMVYCAGRGVKGSLAWTPSNRVVAALDKAFYFAFGSLEPTGKRFLKCLDVSGSMSLGNIAGMPGITPRVASGLLAMVTARTEQNWATMAFSSGFIPVNITPTMSLNEIVDTISNLPFDATDCSLPMVWAEKNRIPVDVFEVYTDSETNCNKITPHVALKRYRDKMGIDSKLVVVAMTSSNTSIANPADAGMLDVVGFDTSTPDLILDFARNLL